MLGGWLSFATILLKLAQGITQWLAQKGLIDAGKALEANESLNRALSMLEQSRKIDATFRDLSPSARERLRARYKRPTTGSS